MSTRKIQLTKISPVSAGRTALFEAPIGPRYHGIVIVTGDTAAASTAAPANTAVIGELRARYRGAVQRRVSATRLDLIQTAMGAEFASKAYVGAANGGGRTHIPWFFGEPWRSRYTDRDGLAWQTQGLSESNGLIIEADVVAGITPFLSAFAIVDDFGDPKGAPHAIMKQFTSDHQISSAAMTIYPERRDLISQFSIFNSSDSKIVSSAILTAAGVKIFDLSKEENLTFLKTVARMNPGTPTAAADAAGGAFHMVFDHDDALDDVLPTNVNSLELALTMSAAAAGSISMVTQRLGLPEAGN